MQVVKIFLLHIYIYDRYTWELFCIVPLNYRSHYFTCEIREPTNELSNQNVLQLDSPLCIFLSCILIFCQEFAILGTTKTCDR